MLNTLPIQAARCVRRSTQAMVRTTTLRTISTQVRSIRASQEEVRVGRLTERNLEQAVRGVHEDGLVVVENAIPHKQLDRLNMKMVNDAMYLADLGENSPFNYNKGNLQQDAPPVEEYFEPSIFLSESLAYSPDTLLIVQMILPRISRPQYLDRSPSSPSCLVIRRCLLLLVQLLSASLSILMPTSLILSILLLLLSTFHWSR